MELIEQIIYYYNLLDESTDKWEIAKSHDVEYYKTHCEESKVTKIHFVVRSKYINAHIRDILEHMLYTKQTVCKNDLGNDTYSADIAVYYGKEIVVSFTSINKFDEDTQQIVKYVNVEFKSG